MTSLDDHVREFQFTQCMKPSRDSLGKIRVKSRISLSGVQEYRVSLFSESAAVQHYLIKQNTTRNKVPLFLHLGILQCSNFRMHVCGPYE